MIDPDRELEAAIAEHRQGKVAAAAGVYARILASDPDHAGARHMMGVVRLQEGRAADAEAEFRRAIQRVGTVARYHYNLGVALSAQDRLVEALDAFEASLALDPAFYEAAFGKGTAFLRLGQAEEAEDILRPWIFSRPDDAALINNLVSALGRQDKISECVELCRAGLEQKPDDVMLHVNLANALERLDDLSGAEASARAALARDPDSVRAKLVRARVLRRQGVPAAARDILQPLMAGLTRDDDIIDVADELGTALQAMGKGREAFAVFSRRNAALARTERARLADGNRALERVQANKAWFNRDRLAVFAGRASQDAGQGIVFVAGLPGYGANILEALLRAHPGVVVATQGTALAAVRRRLLSLDSAGVGYPACLEGLSAETVDDLRQLYRAEVQRQTWETDGKIIIDCGSSSLIEVGLMNALFPASRILVPIRDPRDACLACFEQRFAPTDTTVNFFKLETTARFQAEAIGLWLEQQGILTIPALEVRYEALVADLAFSLREICDFIGLPADAGFIGPVSPPAPGLWRSCAEDLAPVRAILQPAVEALGYGD